MSAETATAETLALARNLVHDKAATLLREQAGLPNSIFGTPIPRHYEIAAIRNVLADVDQGLAYLEEPRPATVRRLRASRFRAVHRAPCYRCGQRAACEWSTCAIGSHYVALCRACDVSLNRLALGFVLGFRAADAFMARYERNTDDRPQDPTSEGVRNQRRRGLEAVGVGRVGCQARARCRKVKA